MAAVKSALDRFVQRAGAQIVREHRRPRDGLQDGPMRAGGREYGKDQQDMAKFAGHAAKLAQQLRGDKPWVDSP